MFPKPLVIKSKKYRDWVKENDTCHCKYHQSEPVPDNFTSERGLLYLMDFHHTEGRSRDDRGVKLCRWSHSLTESVPPSEWQDKMGFTEEFLKEKAIELREKYLDENA